MAESNGKIAQQPRMEDLIGRLREIQIGLKYSLVDSQEKLDAYDSRYKMLNSLENVRHEAETRASSLEDEVKNLREELRNIKDLLGGSEVDKENSS